MMNGMAPRLVSALLVAGVLLPACGGGSGRSSSACGPDVREPLDSRSTQHIFPGAPEPTYLTDPPTSGPHRVGAAPTGAVTDPIDRPLQVHMLETGTVLVQYRDSALAAKLMPLAGRDVVVAPNPALPAAVIATAWTVKMTCSGVDSPALRAFAKAHAGKGAGHP